MSLNNEQKADRLEEMAFDAGYRDQESDAALLAGAEALERLEAIESTSLAMLPKSASGSEEGK